MTNSLNFTSPLKVYQTNQRIFSPTSVPHPIQKNPDGTPKMIRHNGDDLKAYKGQPVYASETGKIDFKENPGGFGHYAVIDHVEGYQTKYGHLNGFNLTIKDGATVNKGDIIGYAGNSGGSTGTHLHFEVIKDGVAINPREALNLEKSKSLDGGKAIWTQEKPLSLPTDSQGFLLDSHGNRLLLADSGQIATDGYYTTDKNSTTNNSNSTNPLDSANNQLTNPLGDNTNSTNDNQSQSDQEKTQDQIIITDALASEDAKQVATFMGELQSQLPSMMGIMAARLAMGEDIKLVSADMASRLIATSAINTYAENHWASNGFFALKKQRTAVFSKKRQQGACDAVAGTSRLQAKRRKAAKCVDANSDYFLLNLKTQNQMFANDNFEMVKVNKITGGYYV